MEIARLDKEAILSEKVFDEVFNQTDTIIQARMIINLENKASELGCKTAFTKLLNAYKKAKKEIEQKKREEKPTQLLDGLAEFGEPYGNMKCGYWVYDKKTGRIIAQNDNRLDTIICYHPILPLERMQNIQTGEEKIKLAFRRNGIWKEITVPKSTISAASKITNLANLGVNVTSENAKFMVRWLSDLESLNEDFIPVNQSSSKLGWINKTFLPYDEKINFDGESQFANLYSCITTKGSRDVWMDHMRDLRAQGRFEVNFMIAASLASVLIQPLGGLPFFVDLWGATGGGKTVTLMVSSSVWGCPEEGEYMGDYTATEASLELRADMLNNLPMILDDTSKISDKIRDKQGHFESLIYSLCSGKGKTRATRELGLTRERKWRNTILTCGERPISNYVIQGGAINRVLELEAPDDIYDDPQKTLKVIKNNYGFAGREFVKIIQEKGIGVFQEAYQEFLQKLADEDKTQKQINSLAIILAADKIATDEIFKDGRYLDIEQVKKVLIDKKELSDNERCYQYILGEVAINQNRFNPDNDNTETWGFVDGEYIVIFNNVFSRMCKDGGFSKKAFLSWAFKNNLLQTQGENMTKVKFFKNASVRCVFLKLDKSLTEDKDGFMVIDSNFEQGKLPFDT